MEIAAAPSLGLSRADAVRKLGISERQLRGWEKAGLLQAAESYTFPQLTALRTLANLKAARVPAAKIQRTLQAIRRKLRDVKDPLTELRVYLDGKRIRVMVGRQSMDPESGQLLLDLDGTTTPSTVALPPRILEDTGSKIRKLQDAEQWFLRGVELEQKGAPAQEAIDAYAVAISLDPNLAAALVNLGTIYFGAQDWSRAEKYYQRALDANPHYALAHFNMGNLHDERGRRDQALVHYLHALKLDPVYADAHYNIALLYQTTGQVMKAMRHWRTYLKIDPASSWADAARRELERLYQSTVVRGKKNPA